RRSGKGRLRIHRRRHRPPHVHHHPSQSALERKLVRPRHDPRVGQGGRSHNRCTVELIDQPTTQTTSGYDNRGSALADPLFLLDSIRPFSSPHAPTSPSRPS